MNRTLLIALVALAVAAPAADGATRLTIRGAGFGHGVGMSQYGAMGFARQGWTYDRILSHYYTATALGRLTEPREVRVLLQTVSGRAAFTGATKAGTRRLRSTTRYRIRARSGGRVQLLSPRGRVLLTAAAPLRVTGPDVLTVGGRALNGRSDGRYRGALEFRVSSAGGVNVVNAVDLDDYVQGVVPVESPSTWPAEALKAQAVAARTYAVTTSKGGDGFEQYPDTRSQVYGGVDVEVASTNAAVQATKGELVTYQGVPVTTFFFSTSGGMTEDVENTPLGSGPKPWLKAVEDPYDAVSPRHRWAPTRMTFTAAGRKLGALVQGRFRAIEVIARGKSPRIVAADVVGTRGRTRVTGATLRAEFGLFDTWAYFTSVSSDVEEPPAEEGDPTASPDTGGIAPTSLAAPAFPVGYISGKILPRPSEAVVQRRVAGAWVAAGTAPVSASGAYRVPVSEPGRYRVGADDAWGPTVRVG